MTTKTETLTDSMIRQLRSEAAAAGDDAMVRTCDAALGINGVDHRPARRSCAYEITKARAMDESTPFVRVVA